MRTPSPKEGSVGHTVSEWGGWLDWFFPNSSQLCSTASTREAQPSLMPMGKGAREEDDNETNPDEATPIPGRSQEVGVTVHKCKRKCSQSYSSRACQILVASSSLYTDSRCSKQRWELDDRSIAGIPLSNHQTWNLHGHLSHKSRPKQIFQGKIWRD